MEDRFTYGLNPEKLGAVSSYLCDPNTAPAEFLLVKVNTLQRQAGPYLAGHCSFRSGRRFFLVSHAGGGKQNRL